MKKATKFDSQNFVAFLSKNDLFIIIHSQPEQSEIA